MSQKPESNLKQVAKKPHPPFRGGKLFKGQAPMGGPSCSGLKHFYFCPASFSTTLLCCWEGYLNNYWLYARKCLYFFVSSWPGYKLQVSWGLERHVRSLFLCVILSLECRHRVSQACTYPRGAPQIFHIFTIHAWPYSFHRELQKVFELIVGGIDFRNQFYYTPSNWLPVLILPGKINPKMEESASPTTPHPLMSLYWPVTAATLW